ncbi:MAG TPA: hypothetical protein VFC63_23940 [Blastocatellia bacterium]|nr:hypothetical protein [Blastocatellia bacterium]
MSSRGQSEATPTESYKTLIDPEGVGVGYEFSKFQWQDGYGAFSIRASQITQVKSYLAKQKQTTFQEEFIQFLKKYEISYDEKYLWR